MLSARMQRLAVFILLGCKVRFGSALPNPINRDQHTAEPEIAASPTPGPLEARDKPVNYSEAYSQLIDLLHETSGDFIAKIIGNPEWLARICAQTCEHDDQTCHQTCGNNVGYLDSENIDRCATQCEHIPHDGVDPLHGEYGACLVPCLKERHDTVPVVQQTSQKNIFVETDASVTTSEPSHEFYDYINRTFPYYVTLMDDSSTTVVEVVGPAPTLPLTEDDGLRTLILTMSTLTPDPTQEHHTKEINPTSEQIDEPSASGTGSTVISTTMTNFEDENTYKRLDIASNFNIEDIKPIPTMVNNTDTTAIIENIDVVPSDGSFGLTDVPKFGTQVIEGVSAQEITPVLVESYTSVEEIPLVTSVVDMMGDLEVSYSGILKTLGSKLNTTNTTAASTSSSRPTVTLEAEGAAALDTPLSFFSFDTSTSLLLAAVIGFGLIMS